MLIKETNQVGYTTMCQCYQNSRDFVFDTKGKRDTRTQKKGTTPWFIVKINLAPAAP